MRMLASICLLIFLPTLAFPQQALVETGVTELYLSGAGGVGNHVSLYGGEVGLGLNGVAGLSAGFAGVDHVNPTWHSTTGTYAMTFAFHTQRDRQHSILALHIGMTSGKVNEESGR